MPGPGSRVTGALNARATPGGRLLARELDRMATEGGVKSLHAKLSYLTGSIAGQEAMVAAGINLAKPSVVEKVRGWLADEELAPPNVGISHAGARQIEDAYVARRRATTGSRVRKRLAHGGGAWVEVTPPDQSKVKRSHRRTVEDLGRGQTRIRILDVTWDDLVAAWQAGDEGSMQRDWEGICDDQLYPPAAFYSCGDIRIAA